MGFGSRNNFSAKKLLVCTVGAGIRFMTTITGCKQQSLLKQHGQKSYELIIALLDTWQCQLLISILFMATFNVGVN